MLLVAQQGLDHLGVPPLYHIVVQPHVVVLADVIEVVVEDELRLLDLEDVMLLARSGQLFRNVGVDCRLEPVLAQRSLS